MTEEQKDPAAQTGTEAPTVVDTAPAQNAAAPVQVQELAQAQKLNEQLKAQLDTTRQELDTLRGGLAAKEKTMADEVKAQQNEQLQTLTSERDAALAEVNQLKLERDLSGKVVDPSAAVKLMGTEFRKADGTIDVDAFVEKYPYMRVNAGATVPNGGGGVTTTTSRDSELQRLQEQLDTAQKNGNRILAVSLQSQISALRNAPTGS